MTPDTTILTIDLGTTTGWALHRHGHPLTSGTVTFRNNRYQGGGMRFLIFTRWLDTTLESVGRIDAIYFEEVRRHLGVDAAHAYGGFLAHLTAWCERQAVPYEGVPVGTIKRHATGKGNASKAQVIAAVRQRGHDPADDNEADALALLQWATDTRLGGCGMSAWTVERVAERFEACVETMRKLPPAYSGGYRRVWPTMLRTPIELSRQRPGPMRLTALPDEITRMEETCRWVLWVSERERQLIWLRAYRVPWRHVEYETGIPRTTAQRLWRGALTEVARRLEQSRAAA